LNVQCGISSEDIAAAELEDIGGVKSFIIVLRCPRKFTGSERLDVNSGRNYLVLAYFVG